MKKLLADLTIYRSNIQTIHWKMRGCNFMSIHKLTDKMYEEINEFIDKIVEKFVQKDIEVNTTLKYLMETSTIAEEEKLDVEIESGINKLIVDAETILAQAEKAYDNIENLGTMDLILDDLREYLEKTLWFLKKSI